MPGIHIEFEWQRDPKGYRLAPAEAPKPPGKVTINHPILGKMVTEESLLTRDGGKPERILRRGGRLLVYRPLVEFDGLFRQFAMVNSSGSLLDFVSRFGPLTVDGHDSLRGESVEPVLEHAARMKRLLIAYSEGRRSELVRTIGEGIPIVPSLARIEASLGIDPKTKAPRLQFTVPSLLSALWLQLGQAIASGAHLSACQQCGQLFEVGPGTGRRLDAKFCSDGHRITYNSLNRSQQG